MVRKYRDLPASSHVEFMMCVDGLCNLEIVTPGGDE